MLPSAEQLIPNQKQALKTNPKLASANFEAVKKSEPSSIFMSKKQVIKRHLNNLQKVNAPKAQMNSSDQ